MKVLAVLDREFAIATEVHDRASVSSAVATMYVCHELLSGNADVFETHLDQTFRLWVVPFRFLIINIHQGIAFISTELPILIGR